MNLGLDNFRNTHMTFQELRCRNQRISLKWKKWKKSSLSLLVLIPQAQQKMINCALVLWFEDIWSGFKTRRGLITSKCRTNNIGFSKTWSIAHRIHGAGIYANIGGILCILMGSMLPYIAAPWILWVRIIDGHDLPIFPIRSPKPSVEGEILQQGHGQHDGNTDHEADSVRCV